MEAPHVFVILLARCQDRCDHVHKVILPQLTCCNVKVHNAIDGKTENLQDACQRLGVTVDNDKLLKGQIACSLSHISVWSEIIEQKIPYAIVLEDDAFVNDAENFLLTIKSTLNELPSDWEYVNLYVCERHRRDDDDVQIAGATMINKSYYTWGTVGYMVSEKGAKRLRNELSLIRAPVDEQIQWLERSCFFTSKKQVVSSAGAGGDVDLGRVIQSNIYCW